MHRFCCVYALRMYHNVLFLEDDEKTGLGLHMGRIDHKDVSYTKGDAQVSLYSYRSHISKDCFFCCFFFSI